MSNKRRIRFKRLTVVIILIIFAATSLWGASTVFLGSKAGTDKTNEISNKGTAAQSNVEIPVEQSDNKVTIPKYFTISENDNIEVIVNYTSPANKDKNNLTFEVYIDTHSVDLTRYKDIRKYVELRTDKGIAIKDGFEWTLENSEGHHLSGILKIKNEYAGKPILDSDTKSFRLVFKNIGDTGEREHIYEGDNLK